MAKLHLFRIRVAHPVQLDALDSHAETASEAIDKALAERPEFITGHGHHWHIGNLTPVDDDGRYFKLGRVTLSTEDQWDEETARFVEVDSEEARATAVFVNVRTGVAGIVPHYKIGRTPKALGRKLAELLNQSSVAKRGFRFHVSELVDPAGFIRRIQSAWAVTSFTFTFYPPNHPDLSKLDDKVSQWLADLDGEQGEVTAKGRDLDAGEIAKQVRSTIASGGKVSAKVRAAPDSRPRKVTMDKNPVVIEAEGGIDDGEGRSHALDAIDEAYSELRDADEGEVQGET